MSESTQTPSFEKLGFHYHPDTLHYTESDLRTWLVELNALGAAWLVLLAPSDRAIPEPFITGLIRQGIEPILHFDLPLTDPPKPETFQLLFSTYARWGVSYITLFDRPNTRLAWGTTSWFEFVEARYGKEGIRQFLYTFRKNIVGGGLDDIYQQAFRARPEEFDESFDKWLKERFKSFRDKQRPSDYGQDLAPDAEKTQYTQVCAFTPSPSGEIIAALTGNRSEGEADLVLLSARDGAVLKNLTKGFTEEFESMAMNDNSVAGHSIAFDPSGDNVGFFCADRSSRHLG